MKQLDRLLLEQGHKCFFCDQTVSREDSSVEHLWPLATGGTNEEQNVVACCKSINSFLGSRPLKEKIAIILRQNGRIKCPAETEHMPITGAVISPALKARQDGPIFTLANTPNSVKQNPKAQTQPTNLPTAKMPTHTTGTSTINCPTCHAAVSRAVGQIDYVCQRCKGAFRY